jgi:oligopeptide transport system permease protein
MKTRGTGILPVKNRSQNSHPAAKEYHGQDARATTSPAWRKFRRNRGALIGMVSLGVLATAALLMPFVWPFDYMSGDLRGQFRPPNAMHWLGTDEFGRDQLARVLYGLRVSLIVGLVAAAINVVVGSLYGGVSGYFGGKTDDAMMRVVEVFYGIPMLLVVMLLMTVLGRGVQNVFLAIGLVYWLGMARIVRGQVLTLKERDYVEAARALGASSGRIIVRHLLPNTLGVVIVAGTLRIPEAIFIEAFLSFVGLGIAEPKASLGSLVASSLGNLESQPWLLVGPSAAISLLMLAFNFIGDGLRDAFDPQMQS